MTNYIVLLFAYSIEAIIIFIYFNENYDSKFHPVITILAGQGFMGISYLLNIPFAVNIYLNVFSFFVLTFLYGFSSFEMTVRSSLFHSAIVTIVMLGTEVLTETLSAILIGDTVLALKSNTVSYIIYVIVSKALMLTVITAIAKAFSYKKGNALGDMKRTYLSVLYPVTICGFLLIQFYITTEYTTSKTILVVITVLTIVSIIVSCFIVVYNQQIQRRENELAELEKQQMKNEIDMQYLDLLEMKNREMQILTHDYKNHLAVIRDMSSSEQIVDYIDKMTKEITTANSICNSGNHTLDIILNKYMTQCAVKQIDFTFDVKLCNLSYVDDFDLVALLGNALDNALEAAEKSEEKRISLKTNRVNTYDTVLIKNSCDMAPDNELKTSKSNKSAHGLGIKSISKMLKKYDGDFRWDYNESDHEFSITIMLLHTAK